MPTPPATITGQFFLSMHPSRCTGRDGRAGVIFKLRDPSGLFPNGLAAQWLGPEAVALVDSTPAHELRPGRGVNLVLHSVYAHEHELRARVVSCELAPLPPSWVKHQQATTPTTNPQPQAA